MWWASLRHHANPQVPWEMCPVKYSLLFAWYGLKALKQLLKELSPNYKIDLYTCLTVQVENLHTMGHFKEQFSTLLQYAQNLANTVYESIKRVVRWAAYSTTLTKSLIIL